jgi:hypothetical protein
MVSNIVQPPKLPTGQLWGDFQGKTGPVALILRFFNCNILLTNTILRRIWVRRFLRAVDNEIRSLKEAILVWSLPLALERVQSLI